MMGFKLGVKDVIEFGSDDGIKVDLKLGSDDGIELVIKHGMKLGSNYGNKQL